jgi:hypothetical protein
MYTCTCTVAGYLEPVDPPVSMSNSGEGNGTTTVTETRITPEPLSDQPTCLLRKHVTPEYNQEVQTPLLSETERCYVNLPVNQQAK